MSWPTDGKPRYVLASISGGAIGSTPDNTLGAPTEYYIYDRANCWRPVITRSSGAQRYSREHGGNRHVKVLTVVTDLLAELNA